MSNLRALLDARVRAALAAAGAPDAPALVAASSRPEFGDYQANGCMAAAKQLKRPPRDLAAAVVAHLPADALIASVEIAGPGFINIRLQDGWLARTAAVDLADPRSASDDSQRVVVDYSAPNLAKEMHVGHLRSTIIGDAVARVLEHLGNTVIRQNHIGDWGTQFGMLITQFTETGANSTELSDLEAFYRTAAARFRDDPEFADRARAAVVKLQSGDDATRERWQRFIDTSLSHCEAVYHLLGVGLAREHLRAESSYNDMLQPVIDALRAQGLLQESDGALCVFLDEFKGKDGNPLPLIVQKTGGGFLYATTDLAAVRFRVQELDGGRVIYVVDARQRDHFKDVFDAIRLIGWDVLPDGSRAELAHMQFGTVLGKDKRPLKTRSGENFTLKALLDEAIERGVQQVFRRAAETDAPTHGLPESDLRAIGAAVGIGAVKYADLSGDPVKDYVFDLDRMIAFEGDTGPYIQYAHARIASLIARSGETRSAIAEASYAPIEPAERHLALCLLRFPAVVLAAAEHQAPQRVCAALHELANAYAGFYQACPVLKAADARTRLSRLRLSALTQRVLAGGLDLLGIAAPDRM
jgi:arginyl-tRNA synthetase